MRRPGDHGLQDQVSAAGQGGAGPGAGRRGRARAEGRGSRGGLVAGSPGTPRVPASRGEGVGCHGDRERRGGGERVGRRGAGGQVSPTPPGAGAAELTRWPSLRGHGAPLETALQLLGEGRKGPEATP